MFINKSKAGYNATISDIENEYITTVITINLLKILLIIA